MNMDFNMKDLIFDCRVHIGNEIIYNFTFDAVSFDIDKESICFDISNTGLEITLNDENDESGFYISQVFIETVEDLLNITLEEEDLISPEQLGNLFVHLLPESAGEYTINESTIECPRHIAEKLYQIIIDFTTMCKNKIGITHAQFQMAIQYLQNLPNTPEQLELIPTHSLIRPNQAIVVQQSQFLQSFQSDKFQNITVEYEINGEDDGEDEDEDEDED